MPSISGESGVPQPGAEGRPLAGSYHVATLDNDAPEIFDGTLSFIRQHTGKYRVAEKRV